MKNFLSKHNRILQKMGSIITAAALVLSFPFSAFATAYPAGNGGAGALTITTSRTESSSKSAVSSGASAGQKNVTVSDASSFVAGDKVLVIQMTGTGAGNYEVAEVASKASNTLTMVDNLANAYAATGAQVMEIFQYSSVAVNNGGTWTADAWNGTTGGVLVAMVSGDVTFAGTGNITMAGKGFGGGGGAQFDFGGTGSGPGGGTGADGRFAGSAGGGGGGHGVAGTSGSSHCCGTPPGSGGGTYDTATLPSGNMQMGSGGGGGAKAGVGGSNGSGAAGGGIIMLIVGGNLTVGGAGISANGGNGEDGTDGADGGGGAGGAIKFLVKGTLALGSGLVTANGGSGPGNAGGGGAGRISQISAGSTTGTASPTIDTSSTDTVTGAASTDNGQIMMMGMGL